MNTIGLIVLAIVVFLLLRIRFSPTFMASSSNDWLILEWHELDSGTHCLIVLGLIYKALVLTPVNCCGWLALYTTWWSRGGNDTYKLLKSVTRIQTLADRYISWMNIAV